jgi:uncharacterized protein
MPRTSPALTGAALTGALPATRRSLAPDLARGLMLLIIATVHAHQFRIATTGEGYALTGPLDVVVTAVMALVAENRGYPMFAALFGYGLARMYHRRAAAGIEWPVIRSLLRRRGWCLILIGVGHTALLFLGDVIAVYGVIAVVYVAAVRFGDRKLLTHALVWMVLGSLVYTVLSGVLYASASSGEPVTDPLTDMIMRVAILPVFVPLLITISVFPFMIGIWAARRRLLENPGEHLALLRKVAYGGIGLGVLGGIPTALVNIEVWQPGQTVGLCVSWLHLLTGYAGGFGYAAAIALISRRFGERSGRPAGPVVTALAATGQRSMTSYLLQSLVWAILIPPYALGLGPNLTDAQAVGIGIGVWLVTVVLADLQRRAGFRQGPAEWLLRRMTYGSRT